MKRFDPQADHECTKCACKSFLTKYVEEGDVLELTCMRCGFFWYERPINEDVPWPGSEGFKEDEDSRT